MKRGSGTGQTFAGIHSSAVRRRHWLFAMLSVLIALAGCSPSEDSAPAGAPPAESAAVANSAAESPAIQEIINGELEDGTQWAVVKPAQWNGTLILDLDGAGFMVRRARAERETPGANMGIGESLGAFNEWLLAQGYAYGGTTREPVGYDFPKAVDYLLTVRSHAAAAWGQPQRTLVSGVSRGAFVVRKALELKPGMFDGGLMSAGGGAGEIAVLNNKLNALFVLKHLVDPQSPMTLVNIDVPSETQALATLLKQALATPAGRARLAFSAAMVQFAPWPDPRQPKPAADDYEAQLDQMAAAWMFATALPVRAGVEKVAGGNVSWNHGVDYAEQLARSGRESMVKALYSTAGVSLEDDLATLAAAPRISADPAAIARAEPLMTYTGEIRVPLVNVDNDDPVDPLSDKTAYRDLLQRTGAGDLFRLLWSDTAGHAGMSALDRAVGFKLLIDRLDSGTWRDSSLPALQDSAAAIAAATDIDLGKFNLYEPENIPPPGNTWDAANWGTYSAQ
ncbi:MAG: hypothetical protein H6978_14320 [Gammaproteobacteria bacterium]|nr:hypothetical protein [Gammaproteobacteria bacterium]